MGQREEHPRVERFQRLGELVAHVVAHRDEVGAGRELTARAGHDHGAHAEVGFPFVEHSEQIADHLDDHAVAAVGPVQGQQSDAGSDALGQHRLQLDALAHAPRFPPAIARSPQ